MVVNVNLDQLRATIRDLEQDKITRAERGFLIRLLRELAEATEKSPQIEGESHSVINVRLHGPEDQQRYQELNEKLAERERLRQAVQAGEPGRDVQKHLASLAEEAFALVGSLDDVYFFTYESGRLAHGAARQADDTIGPAMVSPRPNGLTYTVARLGQPMIIPDMSNHALFAGTGWTGTIIGIPLKMGPRVVGVMTACRRPVQEFSADEIRMLQVLADQAAAEIERARIETLAGEQTRIDTTTGLHNRRAFDERLEAELKNAAEMHTPLSVFLVGIEGFGETRKRYGRPAADTLLAGVATTAAQALRKTDFIARFDDARWGMVLSRADRATAQAIAERMQEAVQRRRFSLPEQNTRPVSLTMGIAVYPEQNASIEALVAGAEQALQQGQAASPGGIVFWGEAQEDQGRT
jgi:diguanylate cyclase (GGDEF)-like protein